MPVNWSQEIQNVKAGQWRKINIKILHASDGNVQFQVTVETWVYDEKIDVDVMSSFYSYGEEEIPDEEISDELSGSNPRKRGYRPALPHHDQHVRLRRSEPAPR